MCSLAKKKYKVSSQYYICTNDEKYKVSMQKEMFFCVFVFYAFLLIIFFF